MEEESPEALDNKQNNTKVFFHYNHTDASKISRWTARESFHFMHSRPWHQVLHFYSNVVQGNLSLLHLFGTKMIWYNSKFELTCKAFYGTHFVHDNDDHYKDDGNDRIPKVSELGTLSEGVSNGVLKSGRWARVTFKIILSYHGGSFDGWQKQPGLNTVQGLVETSLGRFVDEKKAQLLKDKCKPLEGCVVVAGRTDKGVSAVHQVCSFYTWKKDVKPLDIENAINSASPGKLRVMSISKVSRAFHPNFSAKWRRYMYIFPLNAGENRDWSFVSEDSENVRPVENYDEGRDEYSELAIQEEVENMVISDVDKLEGAKKPRSFSICRVNQLLQQLEGKLLSYKMFARDTKASRNIGPPTECFIYHARAEEAILPFSDQGEGRKVMCVELVANRFLRKMVRVLVATSIREAAAGAEENALIKLMDATCRRATAPPAPPDGLCLVDVGYTEFDPRNCIIP